MTADASSDQAFRLMDLPAEVRLKVYDCFAEVPPHDEPTVPNRSQSGDAQWWAGMKALRVVVKERRAVLVTRVSLLSVCRQIHAEWFPIYFRSTDIIVHGPKHAYWGKTYKRDCTVIGMGQKLTFDKVFLQITSQKVLSQIRKLRLDASMPSGINWCGDLGSLPTSVNWSNLRSFAGVLARCCHSMPLLHEVELYARYSSFNSVNDSIVWYGTNRRNPTHVWNSDNEGGRWEEIESLLTRETAALEGWNITRYINVQWEKDPDPDEPWVIVLSRDIYTVHLHFVKPLEHNTSAPSTLDASPKLIVRYMSPDDVCGAFTRDYASKYAGVDMGRYMDMNQAILDTSWEEKDVEVSRLAQEPNLSTSHSVSPTDWGFEEGRGKWTW